MTGNEPVWTLSGFADEISPDPQLQAAVLVALGVHHIEVRSAWDTSVIDMSDDQLAELGEVLSSHRLGVSAVASPIGKVDVSVGVEDEVARLGRAVRAAHALDAHYIRIFSFYRPSTSSAADVRDDVLHRMAALAALAERENVVLLHENEKGIYGDTPERCVDIIESVGSPSLRAAWDPANFVQVGVRPFSEGYRLLRPYVEYLQVKDARATDGTVVPAGEGDGEIELTLRALRDDGFVGFCSMEPHLASAGALGGFSGPAAFGVATRAFTLLLDRVGVSPR